MAGKRQPTTLVESNGRKHLTRAEADSRRDREVHVPSPEQITPPRWLPKRLHRDYLEIGEILLAAGLYTELDRDVLGQISIPVTAGFGQTKRRLRPSAKATKSWPGNGPASRAPISNRPANARSPWGSLLLLAAESWFRRRWSTRRA